MDFFSRRFFAVWAIFLSVSAVLPFEIAADGHSAGLTFAAAADMAAAASAELRYAYGEQSVKEQLWTYGLRAYFPRLGISISENDRLQKTGADSFLKNYTINADQLIWDGGAVAISRNLERMDIAMGYRRLDRMKSDSGESAVSVYRSVLASRAVLAVRESALESLAAQRRIIAGEVAIGRALPVDLAEADLTLSGARIEILSLRSGLEELEQQFAEILGIDSLPELAETIDIRRAARLPDSSAAGTLAELRNPDLAEARLSVMKRQAEVKLASRSLIPNFRLQGSFGLSGRKYPLTRYNWSVGLNIELAGPWLKNNFSVQAGMEPPHDKTAQMQNTMSPLPDPASALTKRQAEQVLALEQEKFARARERAGRTARRGVEKCKIADTMRGLAVEALALAAERLRLEELRLDLGQITRIDLMEALLEYSQKEIAAVNAAAALLDAERELERFLDFRPGELSGS